ncbi:hypothetical protein ACH5A3_40280 [Streptomyces echinatus]
MGYLDFLDLVLAEELAAVRDDRRFRRGRYDSLAGVRTRLDPLLRFHLR